MVAVQILTSHCAANQITNHDYRPTHAANCLEPSSCTFTEASQEELASILEAGSIPLIQYDGQDQICLIKSEKRMRYVAISHVWSQGKGNPVSNSLHQWRLSYINQRVNALYPENDEPILFWIDTICCPIRPAHAYQLALGRMAETYEDADKVLVLDSTLESVHLPGEEGEEKEGREALEESLVRICVSPWTRRLWTLQEARLTKDWPYIQFADGAINLKKALRQILSTIVVKRTTEEVESFHERLPSMHPSLKGQIRNGVYSYISSALNMGPGRDFETPKVGELSAALYNRSTSVAEDESICLADLFRMDMNRILSVPAKERMAQIWTLLDERGQLRQSLLFEEGAKMALKGFRWAPKSFLNRVCGITWNEDGAAANLVSDGLLFECPGFLVHYNAARPLQETDFRSSGGRRYRCVPSLKNRSIGCYSQEEGSDKALLEQEEEEPIFSREFTAVHVDTTFIPRPRTTTAVGESAALSGFPGSSGSPDSSAPSGPSESSSRGKEGSSDVSTSTSNANNASGTSVTTIWPEESLYAGKSRNESVSATLMLVKQGKGKISKLRPRPEPEPEPEKNAEDGAWHVQFHSHVRLDRAEIPVGAEGNSTTEIDEMVRKWSIGQRDDGRSRREEVFAQYFGSALWCCD